MKRAKFKKKYRKLAGKIDGKFTMEYIRRMLFEMGFKPMKTDGYRDVYARNGVVIKKQGTVLGHISDIPKKYRVPTIYFSTCRGRTWMIQMKAKRKNLSKAWTILDKKCPKWEDGHEGNCGWLNGKPVIFDW